MVVKDALELVVRWFHGFPGNGCYDFWIEKDNTGKTKKIVPSGISRSGVN